MYLSVLVLTCVQAVCLWPIRKNISVHQLKLYRNAIGDAGDQE